MEDKVTKLLSRLEYLKSQRTNCEQIWQYIADRFDPKNAYVTAPGYDGAFNPYPQSFDSTALLVVNKWASAIDSLTTPKNQKWHSVSLTDPVLNARFKPYFEDLRDVLFATRYSSTSNFSTANYDALKTEGFYGNAPFSITLKDNQINYKAWAVKEFYVDQNFNGDIDTYFRVYNLSARQFYQEFKNLTPQDVKENTSQYDSTQYQIVHVVMKNDDYNPRMINSKFKRWTSVYISVKHKKILEEGGYDVCPYIYQRYDVMPAVNDPYGYSPLMYCLPDIRTLNLMTRDNMRVSNRLANPALLLSEDDILNADQITPGMIIPEGLDAGGNPRIKALDLPAQIPYTYEFIKGFKDNIAQAFNLDLLQTVVNKRDMTATEVLQRSQEISMLISPITSRRERDFLSQVVARELDLLYKLGKLPPMPEELAMLIASNKVSLQITYESPIHRAQKANEGQAIMNMLQAQAGIVQFDPSIKNAINGLRTLEELADVWGAPTKMFNTEEERAAKDEADAQAAQAQQMLAAAPVMADVAKVLGGGE